jgi:hypothetical protein
MNNKRRIDLPEAVDPATFKYIRQVTGQVPAFEPSDEQLSNISEKQKNFIRYYISSGGITKVALKQANVTRDELNEWKTQDSFQKAYKEAQEDWVEELRKAAMLRATSKSDVLLMFLLKAMRPDVFDEDVRKQQYVGLSASKDNIPVRATLVRDNTFNFSISSEKAEELRDILTSDSSDNSDNSEVSESEES